MTSSLGMGTQALSKAMVTNTPKYESSFTRRAAISNKAFTTLKLGGGKSGLL